MKGFKGEESLKCEGGGLGPEEWEVGEDFKLSTEVVLLTALLALIAATAAAAAKLVGVAAAVTLAILCAEGPGFEPACCCNRAGLDKGTPATCDK